MPTPPAARTCPTWSRGEVSWSRIVITPHIFLWPMGCHLAALCLLPGGPRRRTANSASRESAQAAYRIRLGSRQVAAYETAEFFNGSIAETRVFLCVLSTAAIDHLIDLPVLTVNADQSDPTIGPACGVMSQRYSASSAFSPHDT